MIFLFWLSIGLVVYCYAGYPVLISIFARFFPKPVAKKKIKADVSILISVWNEEDVIERKIKNLLSLQYPSGNFEILIGSDGSTDRTNEIVRGINHPAVRLVENPERRGKVSTVSDLIGKARYDIVLFTDARQSFAPDAVSELTANFSDPQVGCASGELVFAGAEGGTARGINLYWNYEKFIRAQESRVHSMLGATGAIYAIRRELFPALPQDIVLDDMYIPLQIVLKGYRAIFDDAAKAFDEVAASAGEEHRRKARTLYGNYQIFFMLPQMFVPFQSPVAFQLFSHKFLRVVVPILLIFIFVANMFFLTQNSCRIIWFLQVLFYGMALAGAAVRNQQGGILKIVSRVCYVPYVFCLLNFSALSGLSRFLTARQDVKWEKARR